jgi:hypothetical protein
MIPRRRSSLHENAQFNTPPREVDNVTGRETVLNTASMKGRPIVNPPHLALERFLWTCT